MSTLTINDMPKKLELTCTVTGKKTIWTVKDCMLKAALKAGSLDAFVKGYVSREGKAQGKPATTKTIKEKVKSTLKPMLEEGVSMGKMSKKEYDEKYVKTKHGYDERRLNEQYVERVFTYKDGTTATVYVPHVEVVELSSKVA